MRTCIILLVLLLILVDSYGQIKLERTFETPKSKRVVMKSSMSHDVGLVWFEEFGEKWYFLDFNIFQMNLYNMDSTLFDAITLNLKLDHSFFWDVPIEQLKVMGLSQYLFDDDEGVEFLLHMAYTPTAFSHKFTSRARYYIIDHDGSILLERSGSGVVASPFIQESTVGSKLFLPISNFKTEVYHLPGKLVATTKTNVQEQDNNLKELSTGDHLILENVKFDQSSAELKPDTFEQLDELVDTMLKKPKMRILLTGHTDNQGSTEENMKLSIMRVDAIKKYLISQGVKEKRINTKGFGESRPLYSNTYEYTRKKNRRVELIVISM